MNFRRYVVLLDFLIFILSFHLLPSSCFCLMILQEKGNPYAVPISMGIFKRLESPLDVTTSTIIRRIVSNHEAYQVYLHLYLIV